MPLESILSTFMYYTQIAVLFKLFLLVLVFFYFIFTLVVYRESSLMSQTLNSSISPFIKMVAILHILAVAFLFFLGAMIL